MKEPVDKEKQEVFLRRVPVRMGFAGGNIRAEDDLSAFLSDRIRQHVGHVLLAPQEAVELLRARLSRKDEREVQAGKHTLSRPLEREVGDR